MTEKPREIGPSEAPNHNAMAEGPARAPADQQPESAGVPGEEAGAWPANASAGAPNREAGRISLPQDAAPGAGVGSRSVPRAARAGLIGATLLTILLGGYRLLVAPPSRRSTRLVVVRHGDSLARIGRQLQRAQVIASAKVFSLYMEFSGRAVRVKPGDYVFAPGERLGTVVERLVRGSAGALRVTLPEGLTVHEVAERLQRQGLVCAREFERAALHGPVVKAAGLEPLGAEGYLFPATYRFSLGDEPQEMVQVMLERFFAMVTPAVEERSFTLGLTLPALVTVASMVEKEARLAGERRLIASVFANRLRRAMPLQSDPTAQYNPSGEEKPVLAAVHTFSAYNTYSFTGLPPGPIANPGWPSVVATLYPAETDYLYFVARRDGSHVFSRTLAGHLRAIARLRARRELATAPVSGASLRQ